jgi:hypothetical protein
MAAMKDIRLLGILFLALAVRTAMLFSVFADVRRAMTPDSGDYYRLGLRWAESGKYESGKRVILRTFGVSLGSYSPEIFRTPGYPAEIMAAYKIAMLFREEDHMSGMEVNSSDLSPPAEYQKIILSFQVLLDLHLVLLTFFLGRALAGHGAGLAAALLQAISPLAAAASCRILSDGTFAFMLTAALILLLRHFRTGGWWSLVSSALVMGAACYVRPVGLAFSAIMALVILCSRRGAGRSTGVSPVSSRAVSALPQEEKTTGGTPVGLMGETPMPRPMARPRRFLRTLTFAAVVVGCITPWVVRNITVANYWGFSSFATDSMYWYSAAEIEARQQQQSAEEIRQHFCDEEGWGRMYAGATDPNLPGNDTVGGLARYRWDKARSIILAHPWEFLDIHLRGDLAFWLPDATEALEVLGYTSGGKGTLDVLHRQGLVAAAKHYFGDNTTAVALAGVMAMVLAGGMVVILLVRYAGIVLCGLWRLRPPWQKMSAAGWLCLLLVLTAWLLPGPANHPRFRVPVEPILSAAAAMGWLGLLEWRRREENKTAKQ